MKRYHDINGSSPRRLAAWQIYFRRRSVDIIAKVAVTHPDSNSRQTFKARSDLAREWFLKEEEEVIRSCIEEADQLHKDELEEWEQALLQAQPTKETQAA